MHTQLADGTSKTQALAALGSLDNRVELSRSPRDSHQPNSAIRHRFIFAPITSPVHHPLAQPGPAAGRRELISAMCAVMQDLKSEVTYMQAQLGDTANELDRSSIFCLCNRCVRECLCAL